MNAVRYRDDRDDLDPLYGGGRENGRPVPVVDFNYGLIDGVPESETMISVTQASSALVKVLGWLSRSQDCRFIGAKALALRALLGSPNNPFRSVARIAAEAGVTRSALSHALLSLASDYGIRLNTGKLETSRQAYREAAHRALERGTHVSQRKNHKTTINESTGDDMTNQEIRNRFNTLTKACDEIERLHKQHDSGASPKKAQAATATATAPKLSDLSGIHRPKQTLKVRFYYPVTSSGGGLCHLPDL